MINEIILCISLHGFVFSFYVFFFLNERRVFCRSLRVSCFLFFNMFRAKVEKSNNHQLKKKNYISTSHKRGLFSLDF